MMPALFYIDLDAFIQLDFRPDSADPVFFINLMDVVASCADVRRDDQIVFSLPCLEKFDARCWHHQMHQSDAPDFPIVCEEVNRRSLLLFFQQFQCYLRQSRTGWRGDLFFVELLSSLPKTDAGHYTSYRIHPTDTPIDRLDKGRVQILPTETLLPGMLELARPEPEHLQVLDRLVVVQGGRHFYEYTYLSSAFSLPRDIRASYSCVTVFGDMQPGLSEVFDEHRLAEEIAVFYLDHSSITMFCPWSQYLRTWASRVCDRVHQAIQQAADTQLDDYPSEEGINPRYRYLKRKLYSLFFTARNLTPDQFKLLLNDLNTLHGENAVSKDGSREWFQNCFIPLMQLKKASAEQIEQLKLSFSRLMGGASVGDLEFELLNIFIDDIGDSERQLPLTAADRGGCISDLGRRMQKLKLPRFSSYELLVDTYMAIESGARVEFVVGEAEVADARQPVGKQFLQAFERSWGEECTLEHLKPAVDRLSAVPIFDKHERLVYLTLRYLLRERVLPASKEQKRRHLYYVTNAPSFEQASLLDRCNALLSEQGSACKWIAMVPSRGGKLQEPMVLFGELHQEKPIAASIDVAGLFERVSALYRRNLQKKMEPSCAFIQAYQRCRLRAANVAPAAVMFPEVAASQRKGRTDKTQRQPAVSPVLSS